MSCESPVLLIAWRRPKHLKQVIDAIRKVSPKYLYVCVDGYRNGDEYSLERELINEVKEVIHKQIDWNCELKTLYQEKNLGCRIAVSTAISWFFDNVEEGIILEDDCVPSIDFFRFASELLVKFRHYEKVMQISGSNFNRGNNYNKDSYYFTKYNHMWGWATWRRAWKYYNYNPIEWQTIKTSNFLKVYLGNPLEVRFWTKYFEEIYETKVLDTWDYVWRLNCWQNGGLAAAPNMNLVTNIGFDELAFHGKNGSSTNFEELDIEIRHPNKIEINTNADIWTFRKQIAELYCIKHSIKMRIIRRIKNIFSITH